MNHSASPSIHLGEQQVNFMLFHLLLYKTWLTFNFAAQVVKSCNLCGKGRRWEWGITITTHFFIFLGECAYSGELPRWHSLYKLARFKICVSVYFLVFLGQAWSCLCFCIFTSFPWIKLFLSDWIRRFPSSVGTHCPVVLLVKEKLKLKTTNKQTQGTQCPVSLLVKSSKLKS